MADNSSHDENRQDPSPQVNPGYALFEMAKALRTSEAHDDPATRARARERVAKWEQVFQGLMDGALNVGSRTPLAGVPGWATLEVVTGGFATGELMAGGPLLEHERALIAEIPALAGKGENKNDRTLLNAYYLSEPGLAKLREWLQTGHYEIDVPEAGALLVVAWLIEQGHAEAAQSLLVELGPHFPRLRFYPMPSDRPLATGAQVSLENVGSTISKLESIETTHDFLAQREAIEVWAPLYDEVVRVFLETVQGAPPVVALGTDGKPLRDEHGWQVVEGGWPCSTYPEGWAMRAQRVLDEYHHARQQHRISDKPERAEETFPQLRAWLQRCINEPLALSSRNVRYIRLLLARYVRKYGTPDSEQHKSYRRQQARQIETPIYKDVAKVVIARLSAYDKASGIDAVEAVMQPVSSSEAQQWHVPAQTAMPRLIQKKVERAQIDTIDALVERDIITSGDTLARMLPQITSEIRAAGIVDPTLRPLYAAIYRAFRRRRSLLLLNYESQIRLEELPWVAAIERFRQENLSTRELAQQTLEQVTKLAFTSFPYAILPNKLLQELRALVKGAELNIPFVDEIAADIFMGNFMPKFLYSAKRAAHLLKGTLYERYYGIDYEQVLQMRDQDEKENPPEIRSARFSSFHEDQTTFIELCTRRAGVRREVYSVARNGMIIEQSQILTTQNLALLFEELDLAVALRDRLGEMARTCFEWICQRQQMKIDEWHGRLIMVKNTAYAWRQMIFFLSFLPDEELQGFLAWAEEQFSQQRADFQARFRPALNGLKLVATGRSLDALGLDPQHAVRFVGWTDSKHWLLA